MEFVIYALIDPRTRELRYVGQSVRGVARAKSHWRTKKERERKDHTHCWIRKLLAEGQVPEVEILETLEPSANVRALLDEAEIFWLGYFRMIGANLTNHTIGGCGSYGYRHTAEAKEKMRKNKRGRVPWNKGKKDVYSEQTLSSMKRAKTGKHHSDHTKLKMAEARREWWRSRED